MEGFLLRQEQNLNSSELRLGILGALIIHSIIFWRMPYAQAQYAVRPAFSAMEVNLVSGMIKKDPVIKPAEEVVRVKPVEIKKIENTPAIVKSSVLDEKVILKEQQAVKQAEKVMVQEKVQNSIQESKIIEQASIQKETVNSDPGAVIKARPMTRYNPAPFYPYLALQRGYEGEVVLVVAVGKNGTADNVEIAESSGYGVLDASAVKTVKKWRFEPAKLFGLPVDSELEIPIKFELAVAQGRS